MNLVEYILFNYLGMYIVHIYKYTAVDKVDLLFFSKIQSNQITEE